MSSERLKPHTTGNPRHWLVAFDERSYSMFIRKTFASLLAVLGILCAAAPADAHGKSTAPAIVNDHVIVLPNGKTVFVGDFNAGIHKIDTLEYGKDDSVVRFTGVRTCIGNEIEVAANLSGMTFTTASGNGYEVVKKKSSATKLTLKNIGAAAADFDVVLKADGRLAGKHVWLTARNVSTNCKNETVKAWTRVIQVTEPWFQPRFGGQLWVNNYDQSAWASSPTASSSHLTQDVLALARMHVTGGFALLGGAAVGRTTHKSDPNFSDRTLPWTTPGFAALSLLFGVEHDYRSGWFANRLQLMGGPNISLNDSFLLGTKRPTEGVPPLNFLARSRTQLGLVKWSNHFANDGGRAFYNTDAYIPLLHLDKERLNTLGAYLGYNYNISFQERDIHGRAGTVATQWLGGAMYNGNAGNGLGNYFLKLGGGFANQAVNLQIQGGISIMDSDLDPESLADVARKLTVQPHSDLDPKSLADMRQLAGKETK